MDSRSSAWVKLPDELLERVLSFLPVCSILQCRCVCVRWKVILSSHSFFSHWNEVAALVPWFLMFRSGGVLSAYSPSIDLWHDLPLSLGFALSAVVASAGGLLCLRSSAISGAAHLAVSNPLTSSSRVLPELSRIRSPFIIGMVADQQTNTYKILVSGTATHSFCKDILTEIFDSATGSWDYHGWSDLEALQECSGMRALWIDGSFYCLSIPLYQVLSYDMQQKQWKNLINLKAPISSLYSASLLACNGRLVLAGKINSKTSTQSERAKNICIWELEGGTSTWLKAKAVPGTDQWKFLDSLAYFLMLQQRRGTDSVCFNSWCRWRTLMYDTSQGSWRWLPDHCGSFREKFNGLTYEPSFLASA
ncbi:hypothetical protein O6H91_12G076700 [Diphasiastrum complanatum]|uniref:Uncharacterized protein n=2 Tax=Diphasiastrum complanatum TaxID=34168 RepID=A0ACC2C3V7_DIPCM|nr:hypothetical protein O6H91_12G076700 [Diphasiastrum complanatum]KAJ7536661.1 hypothetical protein O6H91_12G076700 [Diphasiastrum complanatum]